MRSNNIRLRLILHVDDCALALALMVWALKCEVRAFGECLGMHRR
jgi:hypothetical protein